MKSTVGIIGAGVIGVGVAQTFSQYGYKVILIDISDKILAQSQEKISQNIRITKLLKKDSETRCDKDIISRISFTTDYNQLKQCEIVVENATENWNIKKEIYLNIKNICSSNSIFCVNTSAIPVTKIGSLMHDPQKVIGVHFMNPVPIVPHVEVIKGYWTSDETIQKTKEILTDIGKSMTLVNDFPGFVSNRISHLFMNEAIFTVQDQIAKPQDVDEIFKLCFGHKIGPLQTADLIGLDTVYNTLIVLYDCFKDTKYRPCQLLSQMVDAGLLGVKSGKGFYEY